MIINLCRIGKQGTGMWQYSLKVVNILAQKKLIDAIICCRENKNFFEKYNCELILVPSWVSNTTKINKFRPILWLLYSYYLTIGLFLKYKNKMILTTTHHTLPFYKNQIVTIHDVRPYFYPDSLLQKIYFRLLLKKNIKKLPHVLTVSNAVKEKISEIYHYPMRNIHVVYNSVERSDFLHEKNITKERYILCVGANWKHKNIDSLIKNYKAWVDNYRLIIVCARTSYHEYLNKLVCDYDIEGKVEFKHDVTFEQLKELYAKATVLVYPSIDEGFGIPPIESMASGTPAIVSNIPVFHEILNDAAIYVEPFQYESWVSAFSVLSNNYDRYVEVGKTKAAEYSVAHMSIMMSSVLQEIA